MAFQSLILLLGVLLGLALSYGSTDSAVLLSNSWFGASLFFAVSSGVILALAMFAGAWMLSRQGWTWFSEIHELLDRILIPSLRRCRYWQLLLLAMLAGVGEELLFRWAIQGWLELGLRGAIESQILWLGWSQVVAERWAFAGAVVIASVAFGLCHALTRAYCLMATAMGFVFSGAVVLGGGLIGAMIAHGLYDFLAFVWLCGRVGDLSNDGAESEFLAG